MNSTVNQSRDSSVAHPHPIFDKKLKHLESYQSFLAPTINANQAYAKSREAEDYLRINVELAKKQSCDLPANPSELSEWMDSHIEQTGQQYQSYLQERKNGAPRKYFPTKAHALLFIKNIAPTKKVDGSWLYGTLQYWNDPRFHSLIHTYLDEIGNGISAQNHVLIFEKLLYEEGIGNEMDLPDIYYQQGAIQLALGYSTPSFLPEVIGFNFGYEVLPLHLLISTYELRELEIDPFYFSLHLTIDNAACGHARQALSTVESLLPQEIAQRSLFYERLRNGYCLNNLGITSTDIIKNLNLEEAVKNILHNKARYGQYAHSDYCRHDGKTVNEWLANPEDTSNFIEVLKNKGWIKINQDPDLSRFWHLIHGDKALMFGVFTTAEQQIIYDWIAGNWNFTPRQKLVRPQNLFKTQIQHEKSTTIKKIADTHAFLPSMTNTQNTEDFLPCWLKQAFEAPSRAQIFKLLIPYLNVPAHTYPLGLLACRKYYQNLT